MTEPSNVYNNLRSGTDYHLPATPSEAASDTDEELLTEHNIPSAMAQAVVTNVPLRPFDSHTDVPNLFIKNFEAWCLSRKTEGDARAAVFPLLLDSKAQAWFYALEEETRTTYTTLKEAFLKRWDSSQSHRWQILDKYLSSTQMPQEKVLDFVDRVTQLATTLEKDDAADIILRGLQPDIRRQVLQQGATSLQEITCQAVKAEAVFSNSTSSQFVALQNQLTDIQSKMQEVMAINQGRFQSTHRVHKGALYKDKANANRAYTPQFHKDSEAAKGKPRTFPQCRTCGEYSHFRRDCRHRHKVCHNCNIEGHLAKVCQKVQVGQSSS